MTDPADTHAAAHDPAWEARYHRNAFLVMMVVLIVAPAIVYPVFLMKALCWASSKG